VAHQLRTPHPALSEALGARLGPYLRDPSTAATDPLAPRAALALLLHGVHGGQAAMIEGALRLDHLRRDRQAEDLEPDALLGRLAG
jgi:hypothetical protein